MPAGDSNKMKNNGQTNGHAAAAGDNYESGTFTSDSLRIKAPSHSDAFLFTSECVGAGHPAPLRSRSVSCGPERSTGNVEKDTEPRYGCGCENVASELGYSSSSPSHSLLLPKSPLSKATYLNTSVSSSGTATLVLQPLTSGISSADQAVASEDQAEIMTESEAAQFAALEERLRVALEKCSQLDVGYAKQEKELQFYRKEVRRLENDQLLLMGVCLPPYDAELVYRTKVISSTIARACKNNTYERLAVTLILGGTEILDEIVDSIFSDYARYNPLTDDKRRAIQVAALRVLKNNEQGWNSTQLLNNSATLEKEQAWQLPLPGHALPPEERIPELIGLCAERTYERLCFVLLLMGPDFMQDFELAQYSVMWPGFPDEKVDEIQDMVGLVMQQFQAVFGKDRDFATIVDDGPEDAG
ncbi:hypothetical protein BV898_18496 [Hypsibius exemplaris]|uniref:Uncharacterized protein n=1 Tax=Hypsibius exemplaris TaxID=2072580 RepID=A0A9X6NHV7_HYPEX|nr:hypothetical protein BV898_18496 [Hypsibius exemplaris]